jgi:hypothetical protein
LQLVGETLNAKGEPHPFAESTLIRTAITAASYSLWMLEGDDTQRRYRALQFNFKDCDGFTGFVRTQSQDREATEDYIAGAPGVIDDLEQQSNLPPQGVRVADAHNAIMVPDALSLPGTQDSATHAAAPR